MMTDDYMDSVDSDSRSIIDEALAQLSQSATLTTIPACPPNLHFIGIRHHSPRCATMVKHWINEQRPDVVLIEAPSDIKPMLAQLLLPHTLPIALFSYRQERRFEHVGGAALDDGVQGSYDPSNVTPDRDYHGDVQTAQSWFPLLSFSPEWVAMKSAHALGAAIDFIDLPHWRYRAQHSHQQADADMDGVNAPRHKDRYAQVMRRLLHITGCDNQDALWERWFEPSPYFVAYMSLYFK